MADYAPPTGPPPPKVPEGWKAVWNDQYKEWFYVNTHTKASQWDKPTAPAVPADGAPPGPPPGYDHSQSKPTGPEKGGFGSNNPYNGSGPGQSSVSEDEKLARQLQAEEEARAHSGGSSNRGASDSYYQGDQGAPYGQSGAPYGQQNQSPYGQQQAPGSSGETKSKGGFFSKFTNKLGGGSSSRPPQQGYPQQGYGSPAPGYGQTGQYGPGYGGYPPPQQQYYGPPQGQYYQQQQPPRKSGGIGAGGALLGAGAGLVGGALLMNAFDDHEQHEEQQAYDQGYDQGYDNGGGGDDYGMDDGGGDF